jgi:hypothetical protein
MALDIINVLADGIVIRMWVGIVIISKDKQLYGLEVSR